MPETLTTVFLIACALTFGGRLMLARRQIHYVRTHRDAVPAEFAARIRSERDHWAGVVRDSGFTPEN